MHQYKLNSSATSLKMATLSKPSFLPFLILLLFLIRPSFSKKSTFIVHMSHSHKPNNFASAHDWYHSILNTLSSTTTTTTKETQHDILYTYTHSATGFAAHISEALAAKLRRHPSVLSVIPDQIVEAATTQSPNFLGLSEGSGIWPTTQYGSDIIIGVVDSGVWPENPSFDDSKIGNIPVNWKGTCQVAPDFAATDCNKKLIGARFFYKGYEAEHGPIQTTKSARDYKGHGTHCATTAGGSPVDNAGYNQYAVGRACGVAPFARIAAYKVFWGPSLTASSADILEAIDQAIEDGVHVLSLSLGNSLGYSQDPIAIGAFHAMNKGVVVSAAGGNTGPDFLTVTNTAPWILTVGASTINRQFPADLILTTGHVITGSSLSDPVPITTFITMVTGESCGSRFCNLGELDISKVSGKMVVCESKDGTSGPLQSFAVNQAGGLAMVMIDKAKAGSELTTEPFFIPAVKVTYSDLDYIKRYITSAVKPTASIKFRGTDIGPSPSAPRVAAFSSRGPSPITPEILKPDVIAPGVNILAGWTKAVGPSGLDIDSRRVDYNIMSGTSMACPHVSGLAALLRKAYPNWSPAAIKSAIMTTAYNLDNSGNDIIDLSTEKRSSPFHHGSGLIDPNKALDPGLVYDLDTNDYVNFLCTTGNDPRIFVQTTPMPDCRSILLPLSSPGNLNVPSLSVVFKSVSDVVTYTRVVKNVGSSPNVEYRVNVNAPSYVRVNVSPTKLVFNANQRTQSYTVTFTSAVGFDIPVDMMVSFMTHGSIEWSDGSHRVRSPIAAYWPYQSTQQKGFLKSPIAAYRQDFMPSNLTTTLAIE